MSRLDDQALNEFQEMLVAFDRHFAQGSHIWNSFGVDNPQLTLDAARAAIIEYQQSADLLDMNRLSRLPDGLKNRVLASREQALAQVATMKLYLCEAGGSSGHSERLKHIRDSIEHLRRAIKLLEVAEPSDETLVFKLQAGALNAEGYRENVSARIAAENGKFADAIQHYALAEAKFLELMKAYEARTPELAATRSQIEQARDRDWDSDNVVEIRDIQVTMLIMRADEKYPLLSNEDLYRRAASNFYSSAASRCNLEAREILARDGLPKEAEDKLDDAIKFVYCAMEAFPYNLEFHRDLLDVWRIKGEIFGCPLIDTGTTLHTRCPIAIKHFIGKWYVSPTLEYDALVCTVCGKDVLECPHYPGQEIDGVTVRYQRQNARVSSVSLVDVPEDPRCRIEWISLPKDYFPPNSEPGSQWRCYICQHKTDEYMEEENSQN